MFERNPQTLPQINKVSKTERCQTRGSRLIMPKNLPGWRERDWLRVTNESVEFEDKRLRFKTSGNMTHHFRGIWGIYLGLIKKNPKDVNM